MSNTFAMKEVLDYTVERYSSSGRGEVLFTVDYAKDVKVNTSAERLPIRGGQGNYKILDLDHTKDCSTTSVLPIVDIKVLAEKLGKSVVKGATTVPNKEILTANGSNTITLAQTPLAGTLKVYLLSGERDLGIEQTAGTPATNENEYSISTNVITLNATTGADGVKFIVIYDYTSGSNAQNIKITANDFPAFIRITGRTLVEDDVEGTVIPVSFDIKKAKVKPEFELSMASDSATEIPFDCDCYTVLDSNGDRVFVDIVKLDDEAV